MEKQTNIPDGTNELKAKSSCNVNSTFNFTVGAAAIAVAVVIGYFIFHYLKG